MKPGISELARALADLEEEKFTALFNDYLRRQIDPLMIVDELYAGMDDVGRLYKEGEYFLSELVFSGELFKNAMQKIKPLLMSTEGNISAGTVVMGTVQGDIHELGKNIVNTMLECSGFEVIDVGVDAPAEKFVKALKQSDASLVGMSLLLTTAYESLKQTIEAIDKSGLRERVTIMIGGGSVNEKICKQFGGDFYGRDATQAVDIARQVYAS